MAVFLSPYYELAEKEWKNRYGTDSVFPLEAKKPFSSVPRHDEQPDPFYKAAGLPAPNPPRKRPIQPPNQPIVQSLGPVHDRTIDKFLAGYHTWRTTEFSARPGMESRPPERVMSMTEILALSDRATKSDAIKLLPAATLRLDEVMKQVQELHFTATSAAARQLDGGYGPGGRGGSLGGLSGTGGRGAQSGRGRQGGRGGQGGLTQKDRTQIDNHRLEKQIEKAGEIADMYLETLRYQPSPQAQIAQLAAIRARMERDGASKATIQKVNKVLGELARDYHRYFEE